MFWCMFASDVTAIYCDILQNRNGAQVFLFCVGYANPCVDVRLAATFSDLDSKSGCVCCGFHAGLNVTLDLAQSRRGNVLPRRRMRAMPLPISIVDSAMAWVFPDGHRPSFKSVMS